jgi:hypothetical protein
MRAVRKARVARSARQASGFAAAVAFVLGGCVDVPLHKTEVETVLPQQTAAIVVGQTDRARVRQQLGVPWITSEYWHFDLFRATGKDVTGGVLLLPLPVPFGVSSDQVRAYVMVDYAANGMVSAVDSGATHGEDSSWQVPVEGQDSILLMVGDRGFAVESSSHTASVLISAARRDEYLGTLQPGGTCTVIVGCNQDQCSNALVVDGGAARPLPGVLSRIRKKPAGGIEVLTQKWLAPLTLQPGHHRLEIPPNPHTTLEASTQFSCGAGDLVYAVIEIESGDTSEAWRHWKTQVYGSIKVSREMPEAFREQPMLIWRAGEWLVPQGEHGAADAG